MKDSKNTFLRGDVVMADGDGRVPVSRRSLDRFKALLTAEPGSDLKKEIEARFGKSRVTDEEMRKILSNPFVHP